MWTIGRGNIAVSPLAASAYTEADFKSCAIDRQPEKFDVVTSIEWKPAPEYLQCCPLQPGEDFVQNGECFQEKWDRFGKNVPRWTAAAVAAMVKGSQTGKRDSEAAKDIEPKEDASNDTVPAQDGMYSDTDTLLQTGHIVTTTSHFAGTSAVIVFAVVGFVGLANGNVAAGGVYLAIGFWMVMSALMNVLNKTCTLLVHCPFTLVLIQMLVAILLYARTSLKGVRQSDLWRWSALSVLFGVMLCSSMFAFMHSSVTYLLVMRGCLPLFTIPLEKALLPNSAPITASMMSSLAFVAMGAVLYAHFTPAGHGTTSTGLLWILINCVATVTHRVLERMLLTSDMRLSFEAMTLINNVIPLLPVALLAWGTGETHHWPEYWHLLHSPMAIAVLSCSGIVGLCLGQSSIMVQKAVTATSMMVLQTTNKMGIIAAAMFFFNDRFTLTSFVGCVLSMVGCAAYGMAQRSAMQASLEHRPLLPKYVT